MTEAIKGWPTHTVIVPGYDWKIEFYDPSMAELRKLEALGEQLRDAAKAGDKEKASKLEAELQNTVASFIASWEVVDRRGAALKPEGQVFEQLPPIVLKTLTEGLLNPGAGDPKGSANGSASSLTSPPVPEMMHPLAPPAS